MRRIRTPGAGEYIVLEPTTKRVARSAGFVSVRLDVPKQFAVDADVRKLLDMLRAALGAKLRGRSTPELEDEWQLEPISGSATAASTAIVLTSRNGAAYLDRVTESAVAVVVPQVLREWLPDAVPPSGDGVGTPVRVNTGGGPLPR